MELFLFESFRKKITVTFTHSILFPTVSRGFKEVVRNEIAPFLGELWSVGLCTFLLVSSEQSSRFPNILDDFLNWFRIYICLSFRIPFFNIWPVCRKSPMLPTSFSTMKRSWHCFSQHCVETCWVCHCLFWYFIVFGFFKISSETYLCADHL